MNFKIDGKIALVTGASRGLGNGCAMQLASQGCLVGICSRNRSEAEKSAELLAQKTGSKVVGFGADVSKTRDISNLIDNVVSTIGHPDILVTNAGGPPPGTFETTNLVNYQKALDLNLMSAVRLIHRVTPQMKAKKWGRIIAITSISVKQPIGDLLLSNMARAGLTGFLKTIATELAPYGITVNALLPGIHKTARIDQLVDDRADREGISKKEAYRKMASSIPAQTIGSPEDFGAAAAFLASRQAQYITGQNLLIDGGAYGGLL